MSDLQITASTSFIQEQRAIARQDAFAALVESLRHDAPPRKLAVSEHPEPLPPFSALVEQDCEDCGGSGHETGSLSPDEYEPCESCGGSGRETVIRRYLGEAFAIAAGQASRPVELEHLVAMVIYSRLTVSALLGIPEAA